MTTARLNALQNTDQIFACYTGMETDLIFNHDVALPGFASYPLLENAEGRALLDSYYQNLIKVAALNNAGVILDTVSWVANRDRGAALGYAPDSLAKINLDAVELVSDIAARNPNVPAVLSAQIGPRGDGYKIEHLMTAAEAEAYHSIQIATLAQTPVDIISAFTLGYVEEAVGIVNACKAIGKPVAISFTIETDGLLPTGTTLKDAIGQVDSITESAAAYFLVNCAHPDHIENALEYAPWVKRVRGIVANASRCSHAELDAATELDDGNPAELAQQLKQIRQSFPHMTIFGGCCGTDMRHMAAILAQLK